MERYVQLEPDQPNPYDSYGEILRAAGQYDAALDKYRMAIRIDPTFGSELGVADTYAVMGREAEAREEYAKALMFVNSENDQVEYELQSALTWIRENNHKQGDKSLHEVARHAHSLGLAKLEAEANRIMAMSAPDYKDALHHLKAAEHALDEGYPISKSDREEERALVLKVAALQAAQNKSMEAASKAVAQLESMAAQSRSQIIQVAYHSAAGGVLMEQGKYAEAIAHLQEDTESPESMQLLWKAYQQTGAQEDAKLLAARLAGINEPTVEQAGATRVAIGEIIATDPERAMAMLGELESILRPLYSYRPLRELPPLKRLAPWFADWIDHPEADPYWQRINFAAQYNKVQATALHITGWFDGVYFRYKRMNFFEPSSVSL